MNSLFDWISRKLGRKSSHNESGSSARVIEHVSDDRPITSKLEDKLGRGPFAENIAGVLANWRQKESLVMALYGPWGCGKTSVKNLIVECLKETSPEIRTLEFNPWQWSAQDAVVETFYGDLSKAIGRTGDRKIASLFRRYTGIVDAATALKEKVAPFTSALAGIAIVSAVVSYASNLALVAQITKWGALGTSLLALVEPAAKLWQQVSGQKDDFTRDELKKQLADKMWHLPGPLLVIVDDIDRLQGDDVRSVVQLVKANSDLPNLVFLLMMERTAVERAFGEAGTGRQFLEKIVQVGFDIPSVSEMQLKAFLAEGLEKIFPLGPMRESWDGERWNAMYDEHIWRYFSSLRRIRRFLGSLEFHSALFTTNRHLDVNPIDLVAIEALRVFEPTVFDQLKSARKESGGVLVEVLYGLRSKEKVALTIESLTANYSGSSSTVEVTRFLKVLFPQLADGSVRDGEEARWKRDRRVCHYLYYSTYFQLTLPKDLPTAFEIAAALQDACSAEAFAKHFKAFRERGMLQAFIEQLVLRADRIPLDSYQSALTTVFNCGDNLPAAELGSLFYEDLDTKLRRFSSLLTLKLSPERKAELYLRAIRDSRGLALPVLITQFEMLLARDEPGSAGRLPDAALTDLKSACLDRIRIAAKEGSLIKNSRLRMVLHRWKEWGPAQEAKDWISSVESSAEGSEAIVMAMRNLTIVNGSEVVWSIHTAEVQEWVDPKVLLAILERTKNPRDDLRMAIDLLRQAIVSPHGAANSKNDPHF